MVNYLDQDGLSTLVNNIYQKFIENKGEVGGGSTPIYFDGEKLVACSDIASITASSHEGNSGYIKFNNGLLIQWGRESLSAESNTITMPLSYSDTNFHIIEQTLYSPVATSDDHMSIMRDVYTTSTFEIYCSFSNTTILWLTIGY